MPLVVVCGGPCTGKSTRTKELAEYLKSQGIAVSVVNSDALGNEETTRGLLRSCVEREVARAGTVVICDAPNGVRGFRYELHCLAKARATSCVTLHCSLPDSVSDAWNAARNTRTAEADMADARRRFEAPSQSNKWERPLFVIRGADETLPMEEIRAALLESVAPTPNRSTAEEATTSAEGVQGLDRATRDVVGAVLRACGDPSFVPGDSVSLAPACTTRTLALPRKVGPAELGRLRRQFVRINEGCASSLTNPADAFVSFLASAL